MGGYIKKINPEKLINIEPSICWRMEHIIFRTIVHLKELVLKDELMDYHKIPVEYRLDNEIAKRRVYEISEIMDNKFNSWKKNSAVRRMKS